MTPEEKDKNFYIGDGVYLQDTPEFIILRTGDYRDSHCDNKIYLEAEVLENFFCLIKYLKEGNEDI